MSLNQLSIQTFRNLKQVSIQPKPGLNLITGDNGSGKTSLLEAIYFLGMGRSFRSHLAQRVINVEADAFTLFARLSAVSELSSGLAEQGGNDERRLGMQRQRSGEMQVKLNGERLKRLAELAELLPIQLITPESFALLFEGPQARRQFIDWGAFHADPHFYHAWAQVRRSLKQRNQLLRSGAAYSQIQYWDKELVRYSEQVTRIRNAYVDSLNAELQGIIEMFLPRVDLQVSFTRGWDNKTDFAELLASQYSRDLALGYTVSGPHKADLRLKVGNLPAQDALSRGQLKLLVCALRIAQGKRLHQQQQKRSIYLVDDLPSELDARHRKLLLQQLSDTGAQIFVTAIEAASIVDSLPMPPAQIFAVNQGQVEVVSPVVKPTREEYVRE